MQKKANISITTIGKDADIKVVSCNQTMQGTDVVFLQNNKEFSCKTNLIGEYNISNLLMNDTSEEGSDLTVDDS